jgi:hypothetical protein
MKGHRRRKVLKKLFIGLIILSALTSEGSLELKSTLINVCLFSDTELNILNNIVIRDIPLMKTTQTNVILNQHIEYSTYTLNIDTSHLKNNYFEGYSANLALVEFKPYPVINIGKFNNFFDVKNKEVFLKQSDLSPPILAA